MNSPEQNMTAEMVDRRQEERVPLDTPVFVVLMHGSETVPCMLGDISTGGAMMRLSPGLALPEWLVQDEWVTLEEWPFAAHTGEQPFKAQIVWVSGRSCGLKFQSRLNLSQEQLAELIEAAV